jgi:glycosyltransferase involved in cell wall biosynthesis
MRFYARWQIEEDQRALLELADRLICFSHAEMRQMSLNLNRTRPFSLVYNAADDETFGVHGPEDFVEAYGVRDFVISVGHVEWRKNQLMLLYALRDCPDIPVVIVGARTDDEYYELCRLWAHKNTRFIPQLKHRPTGGRPGRGQGPRPAQLDRGHFPVRHRGGHVRLHSGGGRSGGGNRILRPSGILRQPRLCGVHPAGGYDRV